jgi:hypothetical protein
VLRAAQAAIAQKRRDEAERKRRQWFCGLGAMAASLLAAAAWSLAPRPATTPESIPGPAPISVAAHTATASGPQGSPTPESDLPQKPLPMTNVEAGRVLATPPQALLAARPLFDAIDGSGPVRAPGGPRPKSFGAPVVEPVAVARGHAAPTAIPNAPAGAAEPLPLAIAPAALAGSAPEAWSSRGAKPVFDPEAAEIAPPPPVFRLDQTTPVPPRREDPPAPPK